jgi:hypothetical protein
MSGFSFAYVRDDELDGISDRAKFLRDSIVYMGNPLGQVTGAGPALKNSLSQNYPNPFNPQTTIAFTIKDRGAVTLKVYNVNGELVRTLLNENRAAGPTRRCGTATTMPVRRVERCLLLQARDEQLLADEEDGSSEVRSFQPSFVVPGGCIERCSPRFFGPGPPREGGW